MAEASDRRAAPIATGTLAATPYPHVLVYARNRRLTGTLELRAQDGRHGTLTFWRGRIASVHTLPSPSYFGSVAYELGFIDAETLDETLLEVAKTKRPHGELLVQRGFITAAQRDEALVEQACRKAHHLFTLPAETGFAFYEARPAETEPPNLVDPLAPVWRGIRDFPPDESVTEVLARYTGKRLHMVNEAPLTRIGLGPDEKELVSLLANRAMTLDEVRAQTRLTPGRVDLFAYLLLISKCVEPTSASQTTLPAVRGEGSHPSQRVPAGSGEYRRRPPSFRLPSVPRMTVPPAAPEAALGETAEIVSPRELGAEAISARARDLETESYFAALDLPEGASVEAARAAFFRIGKLWNPDRLPPELAHVRADVALIFQHISLAHRTLTDAELRRRYVRTRKPTLRRARGEMLRDIELALSHRDFLGAESDARMLQETDLDDAEALALVAWSSAWAGEAPEPALRAALPLLDRAIVLDRYSDRAYFYRGVLQKRLGDAAAAHRDFSHAVHVNPKHIDAIRELRLHEMRARKG
jgi:tetratricopeptide (TPR) repeat protein